MWHEEKEKNLHQPIFNTPPNSHLKMRLIQLLPLRVARREKKKTMTGKQLCTDVIRLHNSSKEMYLFYAFSLLLQTGKHYTASLFCFLGDVSVELISNLTSLFFLIFREMYSSSPAMYISTSLSLGFFFVFF